MAAVSTREIVLEILLAVLEKDELGHLVLHQALDKYGYLEKQERGFLTRLSNGTISKVIELDWMIDAFSSIPVRKMKPVIRNILRMTVYQLKYMDSVPVSAACNEAVKLAERKGFGTLKGFVNGVSRSIARGMQQLSLPEGMSLSEQFSVQYSMPKWLVGQWLEEYGEELTRRMLHGFAVQEESRETTVRCNLSLAGRDIIIESLRQQQVTVREDDSLSCALHISGYDRLEQLNAFVQGWIQVQDVSSMLVGLSAAPRRGSICMDVCAAPGGKSLHLADLLAGTGMVYSYDVSLDKVYLIEENGMRSGFPNLRTQVRDALVLEEEDKEKADLLIADLPCSGLGIIGNKPDIKYKASPEKCRELADLQRQILGTVWQYVKPGGTLIYSTCTICQEENRDNANWFADSYPFDIMPLDGSAFGVEEAVTAEGYLQILPGREDMAGFFIARFRRRAN